MKLSFLIVGVVLLGNAGAQQLKSPVTPASPASAQELTPAQQRIAAARQQIAADPKKAEAYNNLALALIRRAQETASADYDRQAAEAVATGFHLAPQDFQLRKTQVAVLLEQHEFARAREEAKDLNLHNPDDPMIYGYLARAEIALGDYQDAEEATQWMLNLLPFNVPGLLIAADLRDHYGDPEGALDLLHRAYGETSPGETGELASIANRIASIEIDLGKLDAASQILQRADELFPGYPETIKNRARVSLGHPTDAAASAGAQKPISPKPEFPEPISQPTVSPAKVSAVLFSPVPAALLIPQPTGTERIIRNMQSRVQSNPKDPAAYSALGAAFFQQARETGDVEDFQLAEQSLNKSLDLVSADFSADAALSTMAEVCMGEHRFSDAITYAQKALSLGSGDLSSFAIVGDANADMGEYERAAVAYSRLDISGEAAAEPRNVYVRDSRTSYLKFVSGDTPGAIRLMQSAVTAGTEARLPAENLAWLYFELGEYEFQAGDAAAANAAYLNALNIHPGDYRALAGLGKLRGNQGRYAEAIKLYQSAIAVVPMPMYVAELGDLYTRAGNLAEAKKQYQLVEYIGMLGHINQVLHNRDLALFYADHDIKLDESLALAHKEFEVRHDIYTWDALAWALYKNGKYQEASDAINNALRPGTRDALLFFHAGMIASGLGQTTQAKTRLQEALGINPQFHVIYAAAARQQLQILQGQAGLTASQGQNHVP
jgi:tetratricopeptide (TPR) repeat protein